MRSMLTVAVAALIVVGGPGAAQAATTFGTTTGTPAGPTPANTTVVQTSAGTLTAGVITSWSVNVAASPPFVTQIALKVVRPVSGTPNAFAVLTSAPGIVPASSASVLTFPTRIPTASGDLIGLYDGAVTIGALASGSLAYVTGDFAAGTQIGPGVSGTSATVLFSARLEPDADADGYGDETQDSCPTIASVHAGGCAADVGVGDVTGPENLTVGETGTYVAQVFDAAGPAAIGAAADLALADGLSLVGLYGPVADCSVALPYSCPLGDVPGGQSRRIVFALKAMSPGVRTLRVTARANIPDTQPANNQAGLTVNVVPAPAAAPATAATPTTPPAITPAIKLCTVPKLKGLTQAAATAKLKAAGCTLGKVTKPKRKTKVLRVSSQAIPAATRVLASTRVAVTLARRLSRR